MRRLLILLLLALLLIQVTAQAQDPTSSSVLSEVTTPQNPPSELDDLEPAESLAVEALQWGINIVGVLGLLFGGSKIAIHTAARLTPLIAAGLLAVRSTKTKEDDKQFNDLLTKLEPLGIRRTDVEGLVTQWTGSAAYETKYNRIVQYLVQSNVPPTVISDVRAIWSGMDENTSPTPR